MVMNRARWTVFQLAIAGLQRNYVMQIWLVVLVDAAYLVVVIRSSVVLFLIAVAGQFVSSRMVLIREPLNTRLTGECANSASAELNKTQPRSDFWPITQKTCSQLTDYILSQYELAIKWT